MRDDSGAVFVEALIAAGIVAVALGGTFQVIADSAARARDAETHRTALLIAQSELADVGADIPLAPGETAGVVGPLVWRVAISTYEAEGGPNAVGNLWRVDVSVRPRGGGPELARLESLRLGAAS